MQKHRNFSLDFVRGISILSIIYFHYNCAINRILSNDLIPTQYYLFTGYLGVSLFFILSGASLALSTKENYSILNFYKKRFIAIFPFFWLTYIFAALAKSIFFPSTYFAGKNPLTFLFTIFGLDGFFFYKIPNYYLIGEWFLGCIIILYVLFPIIRFLFLKNKHLLLFLSLVICLILERTYNFDMSLQRFPLFRILEFTFGMYWVSFSYNRSHKTNVLFFLSSLFGILVISCKFSSNLFISNILLGIFSFILLLSIANIFEKNIPKQLFSFLSKYSYAAFLLHHITIVAIITLLNNIHMFKNNRFIVFPITLVIIFTSSLITYNVTEYIVQFIHKHTNKAD